MEKQNQNKGAPRQKRPVYQAPALSNYLLRNGIIVTALLLIFMLAYNLNSARGELRDLYHEFDSAKNNNGDPSQLQDISRRIYEIETDTPYYKILTIGYFEEIHYIPLMYKQIEGLRASVNNGYAQGPVTREDKLIYKIEVYPLLKYVNDNTPKDAIILLPPADSLSYASKWNYLYDPLWVEYFIYPRLCLASGRESEHPDLAKRITHVLIVKGIGYDKLHYNVPVEKREKVAILPIDKPDTSAPDTTQKAG